VDAEAVKMLQLAAVRKFEAAVELNPASSQALRSWGLALRDAAQLSPLDAADTLELLAQVRMGQGEPPRTAMHKLRIVNVRGFGWGIAHAGRFATPADFPLHDGSPYSHVHVRSDSLGFVHRSRAIFCRPVPT
jgi:hypothetical protein